ncbi:MAG TPA: M48 family metallopeptidase [Pirellulales bacterium]|nr:M48 family metallopeptidase [Pirellulales bacterium]
MSTPTTTDDIAAGEQTAAELSEAKEYGRLQLVCSLTDKALDVAFLAVMAFVLARPVTAWLAQFTDSATLQLVLLFAVVTLLHVLVSFPLSYYSGLRLERRFGLSHLTLRGWLWRYFKVNALALVFGALLFAGLYWVIWPVGDWWWIVAAAMFFVVSVLAGQLVPVLIMPLFYKIERVETPELAERMERLAAGTGLSIEGVYRFDLSADTAKANAMLAGLGRTRRVLMGDTLLAGFTPDEIEVIFAHEIGHHVFRHIHKMIATGAVYSTIGFFVVSQLVMAWARHLDPQVQSPHELPVATLPLVMLVLTLFALLIEPLQNAISRRYERQCDRYALERTGQPAAYISAFQKLARLNKDDPSPHPLEVLLFHSHPPIAERLAMAEH